MSLYSFYWFSGKVLRTGEWTPHQSDGSAEKIRPSIGLIWCVTLADRSFLFVDGVDKTRQRKKAPRFVSNRGFFWISPFPPSTSFHFARHTSRRRAAERKKSARLPKFRSNDFFVPTEFRCIRICCGRARCGCQILISDYYDFGYFCYMYIFRHSLCLSSIDESVFLSSSRTILSFKLLAVPDTA